MHHPCFISSCSQRALDALREEEPGVRVDVPDDGLDLLEAGVLGAADERQQHALRRVEEGADLAHAREGQVAVGLRAAGDGVADHVDLGRIEAAA